MKKEFNIRKFIHTTIREYLTENIDHNYEKEFYRILKNNNNKLYHITPTKNVESILENGLIPRKNPNMDYDEYYETIHGVFLSLDSDISSSNIPMSIIKQKIPLSVLEIDINDLDFNLFDKDDNTEYYGDNNYQKLVKSLKRHKSLSYKGKIPPKNIKLISENLLKKDDYKIKQDEEESKKMIIFQLKSYIQTVDYYIKHDLYHFSDLEKFKKFLKNKKILTPTKENSISNIDIFLENLRTKIYDKLNKRYG
jgi:hypothetical protein